MAESRFKISIWREFVPSSAILLPTDGSAAKDLNRAVKEFAGKGSGLQSQVYSWRVYDDPFGGVADAGARAELEGLLSEALAITAAPADRGVAALTRFTDRAREIIEADQTEWSGSQSAQDEREEGARINPLLALTNHLDWLSAVFEEQPLVSVTVR